MSKELLNLFLEEDIEIDKVEITRQYKSIDILVKGNDKYIVAIEDKIDTTEHSNQLNRYNEILELNFSIKYNKENVRMIYLAIGDESCYQYIYSKGYRVIGRKDILKLIKKYANKNDVLNDYYDYLLDIEEKFNLYEEITNLSYVNNPRGGFYGMHILSSMMM